MAKKVDKWFQPEDWGSKPLGWSKDDPQTKRRRIALKNRGNDPLKAARALQSLANVTADKETARKAKADAAYFFRLNRQKKHKK